MGDKFYISALISDNAATPEAIAGSLHCWRRDDQHTATTRSALLTYAESSCSHFIVAAEVATPTQRARAKGGSPEGGARAPRPTSTRCTYCTRQEPVAWWHHYQLDCSCRTDRYGVLCENGRRLLGCLVFTLFQSHTNMQCIFQALGHLVHTASSWQCPRLVAMCSPLPSDLHLHLALRKQVRVLVFTSTLNRRLMHRASFAFVLFSSARSCSTKLSSWTSSSQSSCHWRTEGNQAVIYGTAMNITRRTESRSFALSCFLVSRSVGSAHDFKETER